MCSLNRSYYEFCSERSQLQTKRYECLRILSVQFLPVQFDLCDAAQHPKDIGLYFSYILVCSSHLHTKFSLLPALRHKLQHNSLLKYNYLIPNTTFIDTKYFYLSGVYPLVNYTISALIDKSECLPTFIYQLSGTIICLSENARHKFIFKDNLIKSKRQVQVINKFSSVFEKLQINEIVIGESTSGLTITKNIRYIQGTDRQHVRLSQPASNVSYIPGHFSVIYSLVIGGLFP